jgi:hypothetical protein
MVGQIAAFIRNLWADTCCFVLLSVGQVGNLRRIVNPPAGSEHNAGKFAACRHVGQPKQAAAGVKTALAACGQVGAPSIAQPPRRLKAVGSQDWLPH